MSVDAFALTDRRVLIAGATGDLGRACCQVLAQRGAVLHLTGRNRARLEQLERESGSARPPVPEVGRAVPTSANAGPRIHPADLTDPGAVEELASAVPPLDGLLFAAGTVLIKPFRMLKPDEIAGALRVEVQGAYALTQALLRLGRIRPGSSLVYVASLAAWRGAAGYSAYAASKGALVAWARSLAVELAGRGIRVNTVSPGLVDSRMADDLKRRLTAEASAAYGARYPLGPGTPEDVAWAAAYLLSPAARWVTGIDLRVDGGISAT